MRTPEFMFLLQFWTTVLDYVNKLSEYLQNSSIDLITEESLIECCYSGIFEMRNDVTLTILNVMPSSFLRNVESLKCLLRNDLTIRNVKLIMNWLVIQLLKKQG